MKNSIKTLKITLNSHSMHLLHFIALTPLLLSSLLSSFLSPHLFPYPCFPLEQL